MNRVFWVNQREFIANWSDNGWLVDEHCNPEWMALFFPKWMNFEEVKNEMNEVVEDEEACV